MSESRYQFSRIRKDTKKIEGDNIVEGRRIFETTLLPEIEESEEDIYIYARDGDRLDLLAHEYYGNAEWWWILAQANNITESWVIKPGTRVRIPPAVDLILEQLKQYNESR